VTTYQYIRRCKLTIEGGFGNLDLSALRIKFKVRKSDIQTPNNAEIRVYNLSKPTVNQIRKEFTRLTLQAGYESNFGTIFTGNIMTFSRGREGVDSFLDIAAGDGDDAYNFAVVNATLGAGATRENQINAAAQALAGYGVTPGYTSEIDDKTGLPRGKVLFGMGRDYLRQSADAAGMTWSIQDAQLRFLNQQDYLPGKTVELNNKTGLIGLPELTTEGIKAKCLLNPLLSVSGRVKINEADVADAKLPGIGQIVAFGLGASIASDGIYRLLQIDHVGDTRGNDWYSDVTCLNLGEVGF